MLRECRRRQLPVVVINGRVSDHSFRRLRRINRWLGPLFEPVDHFAVQSELDSERLRALGVTADRITVTGNLKFETQPQKANPELEEAIRKLASQRPVLVAGSTMSGEEEQILQAFSRAEGGQRLLLVLAPRHPERWNEVADLVQKAGFSVVRRSALEPVHDAVDVLFKHQGNGIDR